MSSINKKVEKMLGLFFPIVQKLKEKKEETPPALPSPSSSTTTDSTTELLTPTNTINQEDKTEIQPAATTITPEEKKLLLPKKIKEDQLVEYVEKMIELNQPRHLRKEGRKSFDVNMYRIPNGYAMLDSNQVNYNSSTGTNDPATPGSNMPNPYHSREDDMGFILFSYIFKNGRKTIDEMVSDLSGYDSMMLTLLVNRMISDNYFKVYKEEEEDGLETIEIVDKTIEDRARDAIEENPLIYKRLEDIEKQELETETETEVIPPPSPSSTTTKVERIERSQNKIAITDEEEEEVKE